MRESKSTPEDSREKPTTPSCLLAHNLLNGLFVILAECELLQEVTFLFPVSKRIGAIQAAAQRMAQEVADHQCRLNEVLRERVCEHCSCRRLEDGG